MTDRDRVDAAHIKTLTARRAGLKEFVAMSLCERDERVAAVWARSGEAADARHAAASARASYEEGTAANRSVLDREGGGSAQ